MGAMSQWQAAHHSWNRSRGGLGRDTQGRRARTAASAQKVAASSGVVNMIFSVLSSLRPVAAPDCPGRRSSRLMVAGICGCPALGCLATHVSMAPGSRVSSWHETHSPRAKGQHWYALEIMTHTCGATRVVWAADRRRVRDLDLVHGRGRELGKAEHPAFAVPHRLPIQWHPGCQHQG